MAFMLYDLAGEDADRRFSPYCWRILLAQAHKELLWRRCLGASHGQGSNRLLGSGPSLGTGRR
jgi:hypothetical protein